MNYISTRGKVANISFKDAVMMGMAEDGGLLVPSSFPQIDLASLKGKNYADTAFEIIQCFADDIPADDLKEIIDRSYATFSDPKTVPLVKIKECYLLELFHGPTFAFKDVALQLLGNLFEYIMKERGEKLNIIAATSGDTGTAAIHGVRGKDNITITVLYPNGRVSPVQEIQMTSVTDDNVHTFAVNGTFDDCQSLVKTFFSDLEFKRKYNLGAVNSINWARVMAQIVYYFYAYLQLDTDERVNMVVPTGNFGNIFAGYCAKQMGLPIDLVLATNSNDILHRFISGGDYSLQDVKPTYSPSMDIQIASNFERYLYFLFGLDTDRVNDVMTELKEDGKISFYDDEIEEVKEEFKSFAANNIAIKIAIAGVYKNNNYIIDPHTACGVEAANVLWLDPEETIVLATAHPAKFPEAVSSALGVEPTAPEELQKLQELEISRNVIDKDIKTVKSALEKGFI
ncbi:MAG: threonine synthase [Deferribacteraceae bacterium]|jgi:threonine synthase|nr:threonine synthase [Deferribacteraceae bacterium]